MATEKLSCVASVVSNHRHQRRGGFTLFEKMSSTRSVDPRLLARNGGHGHRYGNWTQHESNHRSVYKNQPFDKYIFMALVFFIVLLGMLPYILRKCGCAPPRPSRLRQVRYGDEQQPEVSEEERKEFVEKSLSTTRVVAHSTSLCSVVDESSADLLVAHASGQDAETSTTSSALSPCHICLERFVVDEEVSWSNVSSCLHTFHKACIKEWMMKHDDCPCCRADILRLPTDNASTSSAEVEVVIHDRNESSESESAHENESQLEDVSGRGESKDLSTIASSEGCNGDDDEGVEKEESFFFCVHHGLHSRSAPIVEEPI